jgi:hypothetical protein
MGEMINVYTVLVVNPEGKRLLGRPVCRYADNSKFDIKVIGWEDVV